MENQKFASAEMMIRKPVQEVFQAIIDPTITTNFWFTHSTGRLEMGKEVTWTWEMYGASTPVKVEEIVENELIRHEWGVGDQVSKVTWTFKSLTPDKTYLTIVNSDFKSEGGQLLHQVRDATGGFTVVMAGLKAWLEHGIKLNLIDDKFPAEMRG